MSRRRHRISTVGDATQGSTLSLLWVRDLGELDQATASGTAPSGGNASSERSQPTPDSYTSIRRKAEKRSTRDGMLEQAYEKLCELAPKTGEVPARLGLIYV